MPTVDETIMINRPRADVFAFATDPDNVPLYSSNPFVLVGGFDLGPVGQGTTNRGVAKVAGRSLDNLGGPVESECDCVTACSATKIEGAPSGKMTHVASEVCSNSAR